MLQAAGYFRLQEKTRSVGGVIGMAILNFLERNFAMKFRVLCHEYFAKAPPGMRTQDAEACAR
jgi:hypothetical protein